MATGTKSLSKVMKMLREGSSPKDKRDALTYISSNAKKLVSSCSIKKDQCRELCKLVIDIFENDDTDLLNDAYMALDVMIRDFKEHKLSIFEWMLSTSGKRRLKLISLLDGLDDITFIQTTNDTCFVSFLNDCMSTVHPDKMEWLSSSACLENLQLTKNVENKILTAEEKIEENTLTLVLGLITKCYKISIMNADCKIERFHKILMDKVIVLAYMGHKRQRNSAIQLLQQAVTTNFATYIRTEHPNMWMQYKTALQSIYSKRMLHLVNSCDSDWAALWSISIDLLGTDLHRGAGLINNLLSVEEKAFKSPDTIIRRQAFLLWKLLIDNFALDSQELATPRRVKLLCIPLIAKNSKTEVIALTKMETWWHLIIKLYNDIDKFINPVISQFLNFCFGPFGDIPLFSTKFDIVVCPGKKYLRTKIVAIDALFQLLVTRQDNDNSFFNILENRLSRPIPVKVFQESFKIIIHSVGEAILMFSQLTDKEMKNRCHRSSILWKNLVGYVENTEVELKESIYKDLFLTIIELGKHIESKSFINDLLVSTILPDITNLIKDSCFHDDVIKDYISELLYFHTHLSSVHIGFIKCLLYQYVKSESIEKYSTNTLQIIYELLENGKLKKITSRMTFKLEFWNIIAELLIGYMEDSQKINEGNEFAHNFKTLYIVLKFPFMHVNKDNMDVIHDLVFNWKTLYRIFELKADLISTVKPNEILEETANMMLDFLNKNQCSCSLIVPCLDTLLTTVNYNCLLAKTETPSIVNLTIEITTHALTKVGCCNSEVALKSLSAILITVFGLDMRKVILYLKKAKPAIDEMLSSKDESLFKEVARTWETVVSIFKGLNKLLDYNLLQTYKDVIYKAICHPRVDVESQALTILDLENNLDKKSKSLIQDLKKKANQFANTKKCVITINSVDNVNNTPKSTKIAGGFLSKKPSTPKALKQKTKEEKTKARSPEPSSQDYVLIKTDVKFDVNRLTEHQKESLKRRRDDIPAMYNELSQSCSHDSQQLQEWFQIKADERDIEENSTGNNTHAKNFDFDANKENNTEASTSSKSSKLTMFTFIETTEKAVDKIDNNDSIIESQEIINNHSSNKNELIENHKVDNKSTTPKQIISKKINSCKKNNSYSSISASSTETLNNNQFKKTTGEKCNDVVPQKLEDKLNKNETKETEANNDDRNEQNRGVKRKSPTNESEIISNPRSRRKINNDNLNDTENSYSTESEKVSISADGLDNDIASKRTKSEMSRLKINMVFDTKLASRRRSKALDGEKDVNEKKISLHDNKTVKLKNENKCKEDEEKFLYNTMEDKNKLKINQIESKIKADNNIEIKTSLEESESNIITNNIIDESNTNNSETTTLYDITIPTPENVKNTKENNCIDNNIIAESQDDTEDIVESSQEVTADLKMDKKSFIKMDKISVNLKKSIDQIEEKRQNLNAESLEFQSIKTSTTTQSSDESNELHDDNQQNQQPVIIINTTTISESEQNNNNSDNGRSIPESNKRTSPPLIKNPSTSLISSPKSNVKRQKQKTLPMHGRAAHMLGLVTKQALLDVESKSNKGEDDANIKKNKSKDENETQFCKKDKLLSNKESEKPSSPFSSRHEKIFSNMKSSDYSSPLSAKLFSSSRNDAEKVSPVKEKDTTNITNTLPEKDDEGNLSPIRDRDELPLLEWSSANPPSLTASPSFSILKRQRSSTGDLESSDSVTPNKKKRVSFADPPVSKEMGYRFIESPHNMTKLPIIRSPSVRKDSPLRYKHRMRLIRIDTDNIDKHKDSSSENITEVDLQCERENQLLTKIAEEMEYSENMSIDEDVRCIDDTEDLCPSNPLKINLIHELEITSQLDMEKRNDEIKNDDLTCQEKNKIIKTSQDQLNDTRKIKQDSETQQDIFEDIKVKNNQEKISEMETSSDKSKSEDLEDTVDIQNVTGLNLTANSDEIFSHKMIQSSTRGESVAEPDTLPITDSMLTQDGLSQNAVQDIQSELLDSTKPVYPSLEDCQDPISNIIEQLTNPLWIQHLSGYLESRNLRTIGDIAQLSEREINRMPVKGTSKIKFVKNILERFERTFSAHTLPIQSSNTTPNKSTRVITTSTPKIITSNSLSETKNKSTNTQKDIITSVNEKSQITMSKVNKSMTKDICASTSDKFLNVSTLDVTFSTSIDQNFTTTQSTSQVQKMNGSTMNISASTSSSIINTSLIKPEKSTSSTTENVSAVNCDKVNNVIVLPSTSSIGTDPVPEFTTQKKTKSVASQLNLKELLNEIDANIILQSAVQRCSADDILLQYKQKKMKYMSDAEFQKETLKILEVADNTNHDFSLKTSSRACGINKVLMRLPDIFSHDKEFFSKVFHAYRNKINFNECLNDFDIEQLKKALCERCSSTEIMEMISKSLKKEFTGDEKTLIVDPSCLNAMLKRMPTDVIISHTVANEEIIPTQVVLDIALQNNCPEIIADSLLSQSSSVTKTLFNKFWSSEAAIQSVSEQPKEILLEMFKAISDNLDSADLLNVFHETMKKKIIDKTKLE